MDVILAVGIKSPFQRRKPKSTLLLKKQVKFTDDLKCSEVLTMAVLTIEEKADESKIFVDDDPLQGWLA